MISCVRVWVWVVWSAGWVAVRLLCATRGQADIRGLVPQDHVRRGDPLSRVGRGQPWVGGGLLIAASRVPRACRAATDPADGMGDVGVRITRSG